MICILMIVCSVLMVTQAKNTKVSSCFVITGEDMEHLALLGDQVLTSSCYMRSGSGA